MTTVSFSSCDKPHYPLNQSLSVKTDRIPANTAMTMAAWQRTNILTAMHYLKEIARTGKEARAGSLAQGLAEVLEPSRRAARLQREAA